MLFDTRSYSNHIVKQGTVITLSCFPVNLKYLISITCINLPRSHRSAYAKFRTGVAPLRLETGRYEHLNLEQRVCFNCESEIETVEHELTQCPFYKDLGENYTQGYLHSKLKATQRI